MARSCVALYDLATIHPNTLGIHEGEKLLIVDIKNNDPNWWYAINRKGQIGYVPRTYVGFLDLSTPELLKEIGKILESLQVKSDSGDGFSPKHKTLFKNLVEFRDELATEIPLVKPCIKSASSKKSSINNSVNENFYGTIGTCTNTLCKSPPLSPTTDCQSPSLLPAKEVRSRPLSPVNDTKAPPLLPAREFKSPPLSTRESKSRPLSLSGDAKPAPLIPVRECKSPPNVPIRDCKSPPNVPVRECKSPPTIPSRDCKTLPSSPTKDVNDCIFENDLSSKKKIVVSPKIKARSTLAISIVPPAKISTNTSTQTDSNEMKKEIAIPSELVPEMVEQIRNRTKLNYKLSILSVGSIFETLSQHVPDSLELCNKVLYELEDHRTNYKTIYQGQDKRRLEEIIESLWHCKNDQQQRSWPIYEDELVINEYLQEVNSILGDADPRICCEVIRSDNYDAVNTLVIYYQMEPRRTLRFSLLKVFESLCQLDEGVVEQLILSVLPMELATEVQQHFSDHDRFKRCAKMLTIILSFPDVEPPRSIYDFLNKNFISFMLGRVESILDEAIDEDISNIALSVILSLNIHLGKLDNIVLEALSVREEATALTEKLMLLINREDDPLQFVQPASPNVPNSVLKFMVDLFSLPDCAKHFYVNDIKVLLDIIVRQLTDLSPGIERRLTYHELLLSLIANTDYEDHRHQIDGISRCFSSILTEEEFPDSEKDIVTEIISTFPELFTISS